jgi:hypothetical protein
MIGVDGETDMSEDQEAEQSADLEVVIGRWVESDFKAPNPRSIIIMTSLLNIDGRGIDKSILFFFFFWRVSNFVKVEKNYVHIGEKFEYKGA